ncbi:hypothetical protein TI03_02740 [Achromatium sp. WMS1]|nr:hypothetical protein TI03_02740 [Achromatium sp. WMS1]
MWQDPIIEEIHQIREEIAKKYEDDLRKIFLAAQRSELSNLITKEANETECNNQQTLHKIVGRV